MRKDPVNKEAKGTGWEDNNIKWKQETLRTKKRVGRERGSKVREHSQDEICVETPRKPIICRLTF